jgi:hypothetical protein
MQRSATENMGRKYIFVADGGMSDMAARNNHIIRFAPQSLGRGAARISILFRAAPYLSSVPPRIHMLLQ